MQSCSTAKLSTRLALFLGIIFAALPADAAQLLKDHVPTAATQPNAIGRLPSTNRLNLVVGLPLRNTDALTNFLNQLYDPSSPNYRKYLTPDQFTERFGPSDQDYQAVVTFFKDQGLDITATHPNRMIVDLNASVADIEKVFHLTLRVFQHPNEPRTFFAPNLEPSLDLNVPILHISGLDDFVLARPASLHLNPPNNGPGPAPAAGSGPNGSYMGKDFRGAYAPNVGLTGAGQYVGLFQLDGYNASDISQYLAGAGLTNIPLINVLLDGAPGTAGPNNDEVCLDIEMAISMAPGLAGVIVYEGVGGAVDDILNRMATDNLAKQLSASWTYPIDATTTQIYQQFAAQGQSYFNASGDSGAYTASVRPPTDNPWVTSVGGTTLTTRGAGLGWLSETTWNWNSTGAGNGASSGGSSQTYFIPPWQQGIDMTTNRGSTSMRNLPDVAMVSDNVYVIYTSGTTTGQGGFFGGDSIATPLWAAFIALANQQASFSGDPPIGFLNPTIYPLCQTTNYSALFHDIRTGNNTNTSSPTLYYACPGYDLCTGWGTPTGKNLINALAPPINARVVVPAGWSLLLETCTATNGAVDPGETVIVSFSLQNLGGINTTNLKATLLNTNGVTPVSGSQTYGALLGVGPAISKQFTFIAGGTCGGTLNAVLQLQDGSTDLGTVTFAIPLGAPLATFSQNFDSVTAPALPSGWTVSGITGPTNWVTSTAVRDSLPNSAFAYEPTNPCVSELISPPIAITSSNAQLAFRNSYNTEVYATNATLAYDGGVLEISIAGGAFTDILDAGGTFVSGGYTRTIQTTDNLLNGRLAWAGVSGGFITTRINLPAAAAGQSIQLKWRFGTDIENGYGGTGWYIDSLGIFEGNTSCCATSTNADLAVTQSVYPGTGVVGQAIDYTLTVTSMGPGPGVFVTVADVMPVNSTFAYASPGSTNYAGVVTWNLGLMPVGASTNLVLLVTPTAEGQITNSATVSSYFNDPNPTNSVTTAITTVNAPPAISNQTSNVVALAGSNVTFTVAATGTAPLGYQWMFYGTNLSGQTSTSLLLPNVQPANSGPYSVLVTNIAGQATSTPATLRVLVPPIFTLSGLAMSPTNVSMSISSVNGLNYTLEYKNALTDPAWTPTGAPVVGTGATIILQETNGTTLPSRFYRINCN